MGLIIINKEIVNSDNFVKIIKQKIFKSLLKGVDIGLSIDNTLLTKIIQYFNEFTIQEQLVLLNASSSLCKVLNQERNFIGLDIYSKDQLFNNFSLFNNNDIFKYIIDKYPEESFNLINKAPIDFSLIYVSRYPYKVNKVLDKVSDKKLFLIKLFLNGYIKNRVLHKILVLQGIEFQTEFTTKLINILSNSNNQENNIKFKLGECIFYLNFSEKQSNNKLENANKTTIYLMELLKNGIIFPAKVSSKSLPFKLFKQTC